jgi:hypothetical protein
MNDLDRRLREAGQSPVPPPDPAFATMMEERLRAGLLAPEPALRHAPRQPRRVWFPVAAVAAALTLVLGSVAVLRGGGADVVRVASATDTVVVLPDGTVGPATPGLELPDGSRLQTGNDGHLVAGGTELSPPPEDGPDGHHAPAQDPADNGDDRHDRHDEAPGGRDAHDHEADHEHDRHQADHHVDIWSDRHRGGAEA